jgi:pyruvate dehydrogenase complex dehydrogenase (E1) component
MAVIKVKSDIKHKRDSSDMVKDVVATLCFYYPSYTYETALDLPLKTLNRMLKTAKRENAKHYLEMAQIMRVSQSEKAAPYNKLVSRYERQSNE